MSAKDSLSSKVGSDVVDNVLVAVSTALADCACKLDFSLEHLINSKYWVGYIFGFPAYLVAGDEEWTGIIRTALFLGFFGIEDATRVAADCILLLKKCDDQILLGFDAGIADGWRYFNGVTKSELGFWAALDRSVDYEEIIITQTI